MTVLTLDYANQLDALALEIFDPKLDLNTLTYTGPATGLTGQNDAMDAKLAQMIAPVMAEIEERTLATGFKYTLNLSCALKLRPKKWYMQGLMEFDTRSLYPASVFLAYMPFGNGGVYSSNNSFGFSQALAVCACICKVWAMIIRMNSENNYPPQPIDTGYYKTNGV